jgi:hypothetical protein
MRHQVRDLLLQVCVSAADSMGFFGESFRPETTQAPLCSLRQRWLFVPRRQDGEYISRILMK